MTNTHLLVTVCCLTKNEHPRISQNLAESQFWATKKIEDISSGCRLLKIRAGKIPRLFLNTIASGMQATYTGASTLCSAFRNCFSSRHSIKKFR